MGKKLKKKKQVQKRKQAKVARKAKKSSKGAKTSWQHSLLKRLKDIQILDETGNKLSETIMDFASPLLEKCLSPEEKEKALNLAILAWNATLLPEDIDSTIEQMQTKLFKENDQQEKNAFQETMEYLVFRKKSYFAYDKRLVINYKIINDGDQMHLFVASAPLSE